MQILESDIEQACKRWADKVGARLLKLQGTKGFPDRLLMYKGRISFIEFKRPGEKPSPLQQHILNQLTMEGYTATWMVSLNDFKSHLGSLTNTNKMGSNGLVSALLQPSSLLQD